MSTTTRSRVATSAPGFAIGCLGAVSIALAAPTGVTVRADGVYRVDLEALDLQLEGSATYEDFPYAVTRDPFDDTLIVASRPFPHEGFDQLTRLDLETGEITDLAALGGEPLSWSIASTSTRVLGTDGSQLYELGTAPAIRGPLVTFPADRTATALFTVDGALYALLDDDPAPLNCELHLVDLDLGTTTMLFDGLTNCGEEGALVDGRDVYLVWVEDGANVDPPQWTVHVDRFDIDSGAVEEVVSEEQGELIFGVTDRGATVIEVPSGSPVSWALTSLLLMGAGVVIARRTS